MSHQPTVVVFTGRYSSGSTVEHVEAIAQEFPDWRVVVLQELPSRTWRSYLTGKVRQFRRSPLSFTVEFLFRLLWLVLTGVFRPRRPRERLADGTRPRLPDSLAELNLPNVRYYRCRSLHDPETLQFVRDLNPWLGVSLSAPILRAKLFSIPQQGTLNLHKSLLPNYRGMPPGFWELANGESLTGASVHWVEEGLDTGAIVAQRELPIPPYSTPDGLRVELDLLGTRVLLDALHLAAARQATGTPQPRPTQPANRQPNVFTRWRVARLCDRRRSDPGSRSPLGWLRNVTKHAVLGFYTFVYAPVRNRMRAKVGRCHAVVLLYHRVDDQFLDGTTVGVEQFARQLAILARHYDILDLETFLTTRGQPRRRPCVVITFDDGYADNYLAAALLRRRGLPATFFLSTGMIGTERPFPHDLRRLGRRVPALTWEQVERMADWGFTFGSHTVGHARLSELPCEEALAEVAGAKAELESWVGTRPVTRSLGYPYGQRSDITEQVKQSLGSVDVEWCLSAYGGVNEPDWDPLDVRRCGVDGSMSDLTFRAVVEGWARAG